MRERKQHLVLFVQKRTMTASLRPEKRAWKGVALGVVGQNQHVVFVKRQWAAAPTPCLPQFRRQKGFPIPLLCARRLCKRCQWSLVC